MGNLKNYLEMIAEMKAKIAPNQGSLEKFLLKHGREFKIGPKTFKGRKKAAHQCYRNAGLMALENPDLIYCEGVVYFGLIAIEYAWLIDKQGNLIDPTIRPALVDVEKYEYFGIPFKQEYLRKVLLRNQVWGIFGWPNIKELIDGRDKDFVAEIAG